METLDRAGTLPSLDEAVREDDQQRLPDILPDPDQAAPGSGAVRASSRALLERILATLDERERFILGYYLGLDGEEPLTLAQIGGLVGVSRERIRQIKEQALAKLRHPSRQPELRALAAER